MERAKAWELVQSKLPNRNLQKHVLAVEAIMRGLAGHFNEDMDKWGLAGLLHDLDYEETLHEPDKHSQLTRKWLESEPGITPEILRCIEAHVGKIPRETLMEKAIFSSDPMSGFIVACALMHPTKKLASLDLKFMKKRFKEAICRRCQS